MIDRIASNLADIEAHYTAVVVGSGSAARSPRRDWRAPGSAWRCSNATRDPPRRIPGRPRQRRRREPENGERGRVGAADGLFELHLNRDMLAVVGCGLGGTSLINANVALEMARGCSGAEPWPAVYRDQPALLQPHAERARRTLGVSTSPGPGARPTRWCRCRIRRVPWARPSGSADRGQLPGPAHPRRAAAPVQQLRRLHQRLQRGRKNHADELPARRQRRRGDRHRARVTHVESATAAAGACT
ncbi:MAG: hypothetical protein IPM99_12985 [Rubrivivax sp.]|nr:hypothetical protein [Rubrivivax sp.]